MNDRILCKIGAGQMVCKQIYLANDLSLNMRGERGLKI